MSLRPWGKLKFVAWCNSCTGSNCLVCQNVHCSGTVLGNKNTNQVIPFATTMGNVKPHKSASVSDKASKSTFPGPLLCFHSWWLSPRRALNKVKREHVRFRSSTHSADPISHLQRAWILSTVITQLGHGLICGILSGSRSRSCLDLFIWYLESAKSMFCWYLRSFWNSSCCILSSLPKLSQRLQVPLQPLFLMLHTMHSIWHFSHISMCCLCLLSPRTVMFIALWQLHLSTWTFHLNLPCQSLAFVLCSNYRASQYSHLLHNWFSNLIFFVWFSFFFQPEIAAYQLNGGVFCDDLSSFVPEWGQMFLNSSSTFGRKSFG